MLLDPKHLSHNGAAASPALSVASCQDQLIKSLNYALRHASHSLMRALSTEKVHDFKYAEGEFELLIRTYYPFGYIDLIRKYFPQTLHPDPASVPLLSSAFSFGVIDCYEKPHLVHLPNFTDEDFRKQAFSLDVHSTYDLGLFWRYGAHLASAAQHPRGQTHAEADQVIKDTIDDIAGLAN